MGNKQANQFGYTKSTGAEDIVRESDLSGKHFFITGCTSGIGYETARVLYNRGGLITMACRSQEKMDDAKKKIEGEKGEKDENFKKGSIQMLILDLSSLKRVRESAENYKKMENTQIDFLILNAGVMDIPKSLTEDGFETQMGINHFGHALLTFLLLPLVNDVEGNRIILLSSMAHRGGVISFNDMDFKTRKYDGFKAYGQSKLANISFARELNKRLKEEKKKIEVFAVHPGVIKTGLTRDSTRAKIFYTVGTLFLKNISQGAATTVFAALEKKLAGLGGSYLSDCNVGNMKETLLSDDINNRFFDVTEQRIGEEFPFSGDDNDGDQGKKVEEEEEEEEEGEGEGEEVEEGEKKNEVEEEVVVKKEEEEEVKVEEEVVKKKEEEVEEEVKKEEVVKKEEEEVEVKEEEVVKKKEEEEEEEVKEEEVVKKEEEEVKEEEEEEEKKKEEGEDQVKEEESVEQVVVKEEETAEVKEEEKEETVVEQVKEEKEEKTAPVEEEKEV